jgi:hypothetical protein
MKFIQNRDGDWSAYETPFKFNLFIYPHFVAVVWNYAGGIGKEQVPDMQAAIDWCHQFMLQKTLDQLQRIAPEGARTAETDEGWMFLCDGRDKDMGYRCVLEPGHKCRCYYNVKGVWFDHQEN